MLISSLIKVNKTATTGALSASITHELNKPLSATNLNIQFLKLKLSRGDLINSLQLEILDLLEFYNQRAINIIRSLRSIFVESKIDCTGINFKQAPISVLEICGPELKRQNIIVQTDVEQGLTINISNSELHQILVNLINNAIEALISDDGAIKLTSIKAKTSGRDICISVADNGSGVPISVLPTLFELLTTSKDSGVGLGLWLCQHIVTRYGGSLTHEVPPDGGARFVLKLPFGTENPLI